MGRTPLIKLSPKKTWEGFIGAAFSTMLFGLIVTNPASSAIHTTLYSPSILQLSHVLAKYDYFVCVSSVLLSNILAIIISGENFPCSSKVVQTVNDLPYLCCRSTM